MNSSLLHFSAGIRTFLFTAALVAAPFAVVSGDEAKGRGDLSKLVVVGDSLSAGFQNFSLYDNSTAPGVPAGGQTYGFASIIASQARTNLTLPTISYPGIPPALKMTPAGIVAETNFGGRVNLGAQATNVSVPGFTLGDILAHPFPGNPFANPIDALADSILTGPTPGCGPIPVGPSTYVVSQVACASVLQPTTILVSAGNNDALQALTFGAPPTDANTFAAEYAQLLGGLKQTGATLVVANIPDVTAIPLLVPAPAFMAICQFLPSGVNMDDFLVPNITNPAGGFNVCTNYAVRPAALIQQAQAAVNAYNAIILAEAKQFGATVVDMNGLFANIASKGYVVGGRHLTTAFLGGLFSLDAVHPTNTAYAIVANEWIKTMNRELHTGIPPVSVEQVAKTDPLVPSK